MEDPKIRDVFDSIQSHMHNDILNYSYISNFENNNVITCSDLVNKYSSLSNNEKFFAIFIFMVGKYNSALMIILDELRSDNPKTSGMAAAAYGRLGGDDPLNNLLSALESPINDAHLSNILSALVLYGDTTRHSDIAEKLLDLVDNADDVVISAWNLSLAIEAIALASGHLNRSTPLFKRAVATVRSFLGHPSLEVTETAEFAVKHLDVL